MKEGYPRIAFFFATYDMKLSQLLSRKIIIGAFITVPFLTSIVSTIHMVDLFDLGNIGWMSLVLAFAFEVGSLASFMVLTIMDKIKRSIVWTIFLLLAFMQVFGNVYSTYEYVTHMLSVDPNWLKSFQELLSYFIEGDMQTFKVLLTCIIAVPISGISLAFLKSLVDYVPNSFADDSDTTEAAPEELPAPSTAMNERPSVDVIADTSHRTMDVPEHILLTDVSPKPLTPIEEPELEIVEGPTNTKPSNVAVFQNNI